MPTEARVAVLPKGSGTRLEILSLLLPAPGPGQVAVKLFASGVCHSQLHEIHADNEAAVILGHEATGEVVAKGSGVAHVGVGERVFVTWRPRSGPASRAPWPARLALPGGEEGVFTWADHTLADELYVVKMPVDVPTDVTAIVGCAVMTGAGSVLNTAGVRAGDSVAVFGVGGVGIAAVSAAAALGADPIIAVDLDAWKLDFARKHGASHGVDATREDPVAAIHELTRREGSFDIFGAPCSGVDHAFDCIGAPGVLDQIVRAARCSEAGGASGGNAVMIGVPRGLDLPADQVILHQKRVLGSIGGGCAPERDFPVFLYWLRSGRLDLDAIVTRRYALDEINEAVAALERGEIAGRAILEL